MGRDSLQRRWWARHGCVKKRNRQKVGGSLCGPEVCGDTLSQRKKKRRKGREGQREGENVEREGVGSVGNVCHANMRTQIWVPSTHTQKNRQTQIWEEKNRSILAELQAWGKTLCPKNELRAVKGDS